MLRLYLQIRYGKHFEKKVMKALSGLADGNRLVGIISHVSELKNRIDKQIIVKKQQSGGSRAEIIV